MCHDNEQELSLFTTSNISAALTLNVRSRRIKPYGLSQTNASKLSLRRNPDKFDTGERVSLDGLERLSNTQSSCMTLMDCIKSCIEERGKGVEGKLEDRDSNCDLCFGPDKR